MSRRALSHPVRRAGLFILFTLMIGACGHIGQAAETGPAVPLEDRGLMFPTPDGKMIPAPEVETNIQITVTGMIARTKVIQLYRNPTKNWLEGVYMFPLPENSSVDSLVMHIGGREVIGQIDERYRAQAAYSAAAAAGQRAVLLESERPNIFTTSVANIGPEEEIAIEFEYQEPVRYQDGVYSIRFPMVVGVRYIPGQMAYVGLDEAGWVFGTDEVPDASRILQPIVPPGGAAVNPVRLSVELDAGYDFLTLRSHHHAVRVEERSSSRRFVMLAQEEVPADRDFELTWTLAGDTQEPAVFIEETIDGRHAMLFFVPPSSLDIADRALPREVILVLDKSGSMQGTSISQAKEALRYAVRALNEEDRFNIVTFNNAAGPVFHNACPATPKNITAALDSIDQISANGGTEMASALDLVLDDSRESNVLRQVIFITDGQVGNEAALFRQINAELGDSRLYTVGIGSAPNSHFMNGAARAGRGTFTFIGSTDQVAERMKTLFKAISAPLSVDIAIEADEDGNEIYPNPIPDLHAGEPFMVTVALSPEVTTLTASGRNADGPWSRTLSLSSATNGSGIAKLWAKDKITSIEFSQVLGASMESIRESVLEVALEFGLVTEYTALVAIETEQARPDSETLVTRHVPANLPDGWVYEGVFGPGMDSAADSIEDVVVTGSYLPLVSTPPPLPSPQYRAGFVGQPSPTLRAADQHNAVAPQNTAQQAGPAMANRSQMIVPEEEFGFPMPLACAA